jgi:hypothetical protein
MVGEMSQLGAGLVKEIQIKQCLKSKLAGMVEKQ